MAEEIRINLSTYAQTQGISKTVGALQGLKTGIEATGAKLLVFHQVLNRVFGPAVRYLSGAELVKGTKAAIDNADALAKTAQAAGTSVEKFSALAYAGELNRASQEALTVANRHLSEWMAKTGQSGRDLTEVLLDQADIIASMPDGAEKLRYAQDRFGRGAQQLIPLLNQGSAALRAQMAEAEAFGVVIGPRMAQMAQQFNDNLTRMRSFVSGVFNRVAEALLPSLVALTDRVAQWARENAQRIGDFVRDSVGIAVEAWRSNQLGQLIAVSVEAGLETGIGRGMALGDAIIKAALEKTFGPGFALLAANAGKLLAQALLTAVKAPVDFLQAGFEWVAERAYNVFVVALNKVRTIIADIFTGSFDMLVDGLNRVKIFGQFAPLKWTAKIEPEINQRSFTEAFSEAQKRSAAAIQKTTTYFDEQIQRTREILTQGTVTEAPVPNAMDRAAAFIEQLRAGAEQRQSIELPEIETTQNVTERLILTREQITATKELFEQEKAIAELKLQELQTRGLVLEESGRTVGSLAQEADAIKAQLAAMQELVREKEKFAQQLSVSGDPEAQRAAETMALENAKERLRIEQQILGLKEQTNDYTFFEKLRRNFQDMADEVTSMGAAIADVLVNGVGGAIKAVSQGIWQVIDGTARWGSIALQVGRQIISSLIEIMVKEVALDHLKRGLMSAWAAFKAAFLAKDVAVSNAAEAAKTPALAANATLASISSWGLAVAIGVAALAAVLATVGAFEKGGVIEGGEQLIRVNEKGTEAVLNARATGMLGEETINRLNAGDMTALAEQFQNRLTAGAMGVAGLESRIAANVAPPPNPIEQPDWAARAASVGAFEPEESAAPGGDRPIQIALMLVDSRNSQAAREFLESQAGKVLVADAVRDQKTEIGIV